MNGSLALLQNADISTMRLSVPRRGHVLTTVAEIYGSPIRAAVRIIGDGLAKAPSLPKQYGPISDGPALVVKRPATEMAAWHLCTQWILGLAVGGLRSADGVVDAAQWFDSDGSQSLVATASLLNPSCRKNAVEQLRLSADPAALADLLPYILDPHGPGSRLSVMRDPSTSAARARRRTHGVFYTPADVAEHMAALAVTNLHTAIRPIRVFDPACGTGVFLRAALSVLRVTDPSVCALSHATQSLHGIDIDPWAVDAAAYVLLHDVLVDPWNKFLTPGSIWQSLRRNLAVADALTLDPATSLDPCPPVKGKARNPRQPISQLFPAMEEGPNVIIGNPPYAPLADRADLAELEKRFSTLRPVSGSADMHPLFMEQMIRLAAPAAAGALVLPLPIAFSTGQQYESARCLIERTAGTWRCSFFDREPHALFGEDVKTRNAIIAWTREVGQTESRKMTGQLLKWRGDDRARMLRSLRYTEITSSIATGIPKLGSAIQARALDILAEKRANLAPLVSFFCTSTLEQTFAADKITVFVGGTAYNFLNVFFRPPARSQPRAGLLSTNTVHSLNCVRVRDAFVAYALLSSRTTFWLWHVLGDGFHVSRSFIENLPLGSSLFTEEQIEQLAVMGADLWKEAQKSPVMSSNRTKASVSFPASRMPERQSLIDRVIAEAAGFPGDFLGELDNFIDSVVAARPSGEPEEFCKEGVLIG